MEKSKASEFIESNFNNRRQALKPLLEAAKLLEETEREENQLMAIKITWVKPLDDVLGRKTMVKKFTSKKGTEYEADCVPELDVIVIGTPTEKKDESGAITGYSYQVYDQKLDASFSISAPNLLEGSSFKGVAFIDVRGGALEQKPEGWFSASKAVLIQQKQQ